MVMCVDYRVDLRRIHERLPRILRRKYMSDIEERLSELVGDLPRGRYADFIGKPPNAHFESPLNIASTESLRFDIENNQSSKIFLGVVGGKVVTGERLPDGRITRWVEGGVPVGVGDDRHVCLLYTSPSPRD